MKIRKFEWILRQFKEEIRRLSSAKSSLVTQKWRSDARNCGFSFLRHTLRRTVQFGCKFSSIDAYTNVSARMLSEA